MIFFLFIFIYKAKATDIHSQYFHDEYSWIGRSFYFELLLKGDFKNKLWSTNNVDGDPKLASYIYGLFLYPDYLKEKKFKGKDYDMVRYLIDHNFYDDQFLNWPSRYKYNKYLGKSFVLWRASDASEQPLNNLLRTYGSNFEKTIDTIFRARLGAVIFLSLSVVIAYFIFILAFNSYFISILLSFLYGLSSFVIFYGIVAGTESIYLFFFNLTLLSLICFFSGKKQRFIFIVISTISCALLNQTKLNGILFIPLIVILLTIDSFEKNIKLWFIKVFLTVGLFILIYFISNPFLYSNFIRKVIFQYRWTYNTSLDQQLNLFRPQALLTVRERLDFINGYFFDKTSQVLAPIIVKDKNIIFSFIVLAKLLFILGLLKQIRNIIIRKVIVGNVTTIAFIFFYISLLVYLMLAWQRYLIHMVFFTFYFIGHGIIFSFQSIKYLKLKFRI